ncbi:Eco57I restriction-modification methylase domain-containing protein [Altererythrobacter lauratis]|uniref:site-specific DNA-methyltransferase (adenine-specific) n=1 Tax=Alteraurantiacibacter lauratis TaxID=2054627 RepID=A0ABV7EHJ3_9SPHN
MKARPAFDYQPPLFGDCPIEQAVHAMANAGVEERGAIFTRTEVVEFILDLAGYDPALPLHTMRLLEPSFGGGDFLFAAIERLLNAYHRHGGSNPEVDLVSAVRAVELHHASVTETGMALESLLVEKGVARSAAATLRKAWLVQGDFLLTEFDRRFDFVVGNPPYVRQELIADALMAEYRRRYRTIYDRADIYIPFIERSLDLLNPGGVLGFICADRWMKNRYGRPLRELVASGYHLRAFVDMVDTPAFTTDVIAYPGIFVIANEAGKTTAVAKRPEVSSEALTSLARAMTGKASAGPEVHESAIVHRGGEPWIVETNPGIDLVRALEARLPTLEAAGCKVGIGVATGADQAFIAPFDALDVEEDRKLPLVMTRDIHSGEIVWRGYGVVNPFADEGGLVALADYPRLAHYLEARKEEIAGRHVAKKSPAGWYRTIDRIYPALVGKPKLLIPDIKGEAHIVYDEGRFYPHHNLYYITSDTWDLRALQAVLLSGIARLFISTYSTKMRGGYLRYQAQYLRRICVPQWADVPQELRAELVAAGISRNRARCDAAMTALYQLSAAEADALTDGAIA